MTYLQKIKTDFDGIEFVNQSIPCTQEEVNFLEQQLGYSLPIAYKEFLLWIGHNPREILDFSDCCIDELFELQQDIILILQEHNILESLPTDAFVFCLHQGYQFMFFRTSEGNDPPVYFYTQGQEEPYFTKAYDSFTKCLNDSLNARKKFREDNRDFLEEWEREQKNASFWEQYPKVQFLLAYYFELNYTNYISDRELIKDYINNGTESGAREAINEGRIFLSLEPLPFEELKSIFHLQKFFETPEEARNWLVHLLETLELALQ